LAQQTAERSGQFYTALWIYNFRFKILNFATRKNVKALANKTSQHILSTSANLLGFCLFILTSIHLADRTANSRIDELTSGIALLLTVSSILSFMSIKTDNAKREYRLEQTADYLFFCALAGIFTIITYITALFWYY